MTEAFETKYGISVAHAWGMTELSPLGSFCSLKPETAHLAGEALYDLKVKQGHPPFTVDMKITDDEGRLKPWDGASFGRLKVKGPAVARAYFKGDGGSILDDEGFFDTGDVATIDPNGYMQITDRAKDVIKSGGEWISSIDIENLAVGHPAVAEAAVIGVAHPKWDERPLLIVVPNRARSATRPRSSHSWKAGSRNGGCRTTWPSWRRYRTRPRARSRRPRSARCSPITGCRRPEGRAGRAPGADRRPVPSVA